MSELLRWKLQLALIEKVRQTDAMNIELVRSYIAETLAVPKWWRIEPTAAAIEEGEAKV